MIQKYVSTLFFIHLILQTVEMKRKQQKNEILDFTLTLLIVQLNLYVE